MRKLYVLNFNQKIYPDKFMSFFRMVDPHFCPIDRFGVAQPLNDIEIYKDPWPEFTKKSFRDICFERINELVRKKKPLLYFSSGGVDSLMVISLFVIAGYADRIKVVHFENGEVIPDIIFFFRSLGVDYKVYAEDVSFNFKDYCVVDGILGDTFESFAFPNVFIKNVSEFERRFNSFLRDDEIRDWAEKAPVSLKSIEDYVWYLGEYCLKYRSGYFCLRNLCYVLTGQMLDFNNHELFFMNKAFSDYAYTHYEDIVHSNSGFYKQKYKDIIFEVFKGSKKRELISNMGKVNSILGTESSTAFRSRFERMMNEKARSDKYYVKVFYDGVKFSVQYVKSDYVGRIV